MGKYDAQLKKMSDSIASKLHNTGDFSLIEPGFKFERTGANIDGVLNDNPARNLYLELKPELAEQSYPGCNGKILLLMHHDTMGAYEIAAKVNAATRSGIHTGNILYRYINSSNPETQGPLFRRFVLEEDKKKGAKYHEKGVYNQDSLLRALVPVSAYLLEKYERAYPGERFEKHLSLMQEKENFTSEQIIALEESLKKAKTRLNNFRKLRGIESEGAYSTAYLNMPVYFQPESAKLPEMIKRYRFLNVKRKAIDHFQKLKICDAEEVYEPAVAEAFSNFSIRPYKKADPTNVIRPKLSGYKNKRVKTPFPWRTVPDPLLLADIFGIPNIEVKTDGGRMLRYNIGLIMEAINLGITHDGLVERASIQAESIDDSKKKNSGKLIKVLDDILSIEDEGYGDQTGQTGKRVIFVPSQSRTGLQHIVTEKTARNGNKSYICSCEDFTFTTKKQIEAGYECKHIRSVRDMVEE